MSDRMMEIFFEIHRDLPREGPGDAVSTGKAFEMLDEVPPEPRILDIGCGPGMQTLDLARLTRGSIVAVDNHQPFLDQLARRAEEEGASGRLQIVNGDMTALEFPPGSFDVLWCEGAAYIMGFENALRTWRPLLRPGGRLAATEVSWLRADAPEELQRFWDEEYPAIQDIEANLAAVQRAGYRPTGHFTLPASSWWDDYYDPLTVQLKSLRQRRADDPVALEVIEMHEREMDIYRRYSEYYGYVFFVAQVEDAPRVAR